MKTYKVIINVKDEKLKEILREATARLVEDVQPETESHRY